MFADNSAVVAHRAENIQRIVDRFAQTVAQFSLKINIKKAECLYQPVKLINPPPEPVTLYINREPLVHCTDSKYLDSMVSNNSMMDK